MLAKDEGIIAGVDVAQRILEKLDPNIDFTINIEDGSPVRHGDVVFLAEGNVRALLMGERLVLNVMQRMSGIASQTNEYVKRLHGLHTKVLDTRKTTPGMRLLDKYSVFLGGGVNHRIGLFDMILIKDNHIDYAGGIKPAIESVKDYLKKTQRNLKIEVEARNLEDVRVILEAGGVYRILLDHFDLSTTRKAVSLIQGICEIESSGNITLETIRDYALCGVDYISVGALTHHIRSLDLSMKAVIQ